MFQTCYIVWISVRYREKIPINQLSTYHALPVSCHVAPLEIAKPGAEIRKQCFVTFGALFDYLVNTLGNCEKRGQILRVSGKSINVF